jgi:carboxyl-terminal processing protease
LTFVWPFLLLVMSFFLVAGCASEAEPAPTPTPTARSPLVVETRLTADEREEIFSTVWQTVKDEYFDPTFGGKDWEAIGESYRKMLATVEDDSTFWFDVVNPMLFELGVSHIGALPAELASQMDPMVFSAGTLGMDVRLLDGQIVITQVIPGFPAAEAGLRPGFVIRTVNGRTPEDIAAQSPSTPPNNERNQRANLVVSLRSQLYGESGNEIEVQYLDQDNQPHRSSLRYAPRSASTCVPIDPSLPPACTELEVERLADGVGYLRFSGFLPPVLDPVLRAIDDMGETPGLIIDLRGNPGGVFPVRKGIAEKLVGQHTLFMRYQRRDGLEEAYLDLVEDAYQGEIAILVDELSASSAEEFAGSLQATGRATVIGSQTPGRCLVAEIWPLAADAVLIYPYGQSQTPSGRILEDNGVEPDIEIALDRELLLHGVDSQLKAAIEFLRAGK